MLLCNKYERTFFYVPEIFSLMLFPRLNYVWVGVWPRGIDHVRCLYSFYIKTTEKDLRMNLDWISALKKPKPCTTLLRFNNSTKLSCSFPSPSSMTTFPGSNSKASHRAHKNLRVGKDSHNSLQIGSNLGKKAKLFPTSIYEEGTEGL